MSDLGMIGDYTLLKLLGKGSLGTVYLAEQRLMRRQFAVKVLSEELSADRSFVQRLERDISLLASLNHPHLIQIHNISSSQGRYFIVIDAISDSEGESTNLQKYLSLRGGVVPEQMAIDLLEQVASALEYGHKAAGEGHRLAHRNLKPNNILLSGPSTSPHLYLSDFGLSRIIGSSTVLLRTLEGVAEALHLAQQGHSQPEGGHRQQLHSSFLQNWAFFAPEQRQALPTRDEWENGRAIDAYAFGVLAYYLLMGSYPEGRFPLPSRCGFSSIDWDELICRCLDPVPAQRPSELIALLEPSSSPAHSHSTSAHQPAAPVAVAMASAAAIAAKKEERSAPQQSSSSSYGSEIFSTEAEAPLFEKSSPPAFMFQPELTVKHYSPEQREVKQVEPLLTDMAVVRGGSYLRGRDKASRDEAPRHQILLDSFAIDIHPVTNEQFLLFLEAIGGEKDNQHRDVIRLRDSRIKRTTGKLLIESGYAKHPVVGVTWYGAMAYAKWVGKRLPTEAEWEVAAYGGTESHAYPTGEEIEKSQANFFSSDTTPVKSYAANGYGLYDLAGNVYEWCYDWYDYTYYERSMQEPENPKGPTQGVYRVLRGGCWKSLKEDLRCSKRHRNNPGTVNSTYGFRCASDA